MNAPALSTERSPFRGRLILAEQMRRDNLALDRAFLVALFFIDGGEGVPRDADDGVDADDFGQEFDGRVERAFGVGLVRLADQALHFGRGFDVGSGTASSLYGGA